MPRESGCPESKPGLLGVSNSDSIIIIIIIITMTMFMVLSS